MKIEKYLEAEFHVFLSNFIGIRRLVLGGSHIRTQSALCFLLCSCFFISFVFNF